MHKLRRNPNVLTILTFRAISIPSTPILESQPPTPGRKCYRNQSVTRTNAWNDPLFRTILSSILRGQISIISPWKVSTYHPMRDMRFKAISACLLGFQKVGLLWLGLTQLEYLNCVCAHMLVVCKYNWLFYLSLTLSIVCGNKCVCDSRPTALNTASGLAFRTFASKIVNVYAVSKQKVCFLLCNEIFFLADNQPTKHKSKK